MYFVTDFFNSLPISDSLRARLYSGNPDPQHRLYLELPTIFAAAFPGVSEEQLKTLTLSSYLYFRYILFLDDLLDGDTSCTGPGQGQLLLTYVKLHEHAIRGLAHLFPEGHSFWLDFANCQRVFALAQHQEQVAARQPGGWTRAAFEQLAIGKSAVSEALVYALHGLSGDGHNLGVALECLRQYHLASQYEDDILDFCQDYERGQNTYVYSQVIGYVQQHGISTTPALPPKKLQQYLYTSGIAEQHLTRAEHFYRRVAAQAQLLGLDPMHLAAVSKAKAVAHLRIEIRELVAAATVRASELLQSQAA